MGKFLVLDGKSFRYFLLKQEKSSSECPMKCFFFVFDNFLNMSLTLTQLRENVTHTFYQYLDT